MVPFTFNRIALWLSSDGWEQMKETDGPNWISKSSNQILLKFHQRQVWFCPCMYGDVWLAYKHATYYLLDRFLYITPTCNDIPCLTLATFTQNVCIVLNFTTSKTSNFLNNDKGFHRTQTKSSPSFKLQTTTYKVNCVNTAYEAYWVCLFLLVTIRSLMN